VSQNDWETETGKKEKAARGGRTIGGKEGSGKNWPEMEKLNWYQFPFDLTRPKEKGNEDSIRSEQPGSVPKTSGKKEKSMNIR